MFESLASGSRRVECHRTSATQLPDHDGAFDAVITDPPYYDYISYADLSDFFYVWLKRSVGFLFEDGFSGELTPKRREAIMAPYRHNGDKAAARAFYEDEMAKAFSEDTAFSSRAAHSSACMRTRRRSAGRYLSRRYAVQTSRSRRLGHLTLR